RTAQCQSQLTAIRSQHELCHVTLIHGQDSRSTGGACSVAVSCRAGGFVCRLFAVFRCGYSFFPLLDFLTKADYAYVTEYDLCRAFIDHFVAGTQIKQYIDMIA